MNEQTTPHTPLSPLHLPGHASVALLDQPGVCLCPSWAHGPNCRSLPSPMPAQPILPQPKNKRALPTWSRNKTCLYKGRSKALTPEPGRRIWSKLMGEPSGDRIGADLFGSGGAAEVRLHGSYPRLIGADSDVVLWDLRKAQQALADIQHKLANREIDLLEGDKRMRGWILARCDHMQRHRAVKQQARVFAVWSSSTTLGISSRKLRTDLAEAHERELNLQQQLAAESQKHERVATAMARRIHEGADRVARLEHEMLDLRAQTLEATRSAFQAEEAANAKVLLIKENLTRETERGRALEEALNEHQHELNALKKSMKIAERKHAQELAAVRVLVNELDDSEALGNRLLRQQVLNSSCHQSSARKLTALQAYLMHQDEGIEAVRRSNAKMSQADPNKVAIFGGKESFWAGLESFNGRMMALKDEQLLELMRLEFQQCADPSIREIRVSESCSTDLNLEWEFAECPLPGKLYPGALKHPHSASLAFSRSPTPLLELMQSDIPQRAGLSRPEVLAARLFTGPCHRVLNSALRQERLLKGKRDCPRFAYFDMSVLIEDVLDFAGTHHWKASCGLRWISIWKLVAEELNWSSMFAVKMQEAMEAIQLAPTCAIFVNAASKRVVIVDVTLEGDFWEPWQEAAGVFVKRHDEEGDVKMKQERQRKADLEKKRRKEEETRRKLEENELEKKKIYAALKDGAVAEDKTAQDAEKDVDVTQVSSEALDVEESMLGEVHPVEQGAAPLGSDAVGGGSGQEPGQGLGVVDDGSDPGGGGDGDGESSMGAGAPQNATYGKVQDRNADLIQKLHLLLGDEWVVEGCPVIAESFGITQSLAERQVEIKPQVTEAGAGTNRRSDTMHAHLLPAEWCSEEVQEDACECVGCIHKLCKALQASPSGKLNLAHAVLNASVVGGCGKFNYGACQDAGRCHACKQGELWKCPYQQRACKNCAPGTDSFSCTISVLNSAVVKLSSASPPLPGDLVFRGIKGLAMPVELLEQAATTSNDGSTTHHVYRDFVELGFCSVTSRKEEALQHAGTQQCESCCGGVCKSWVSEDGICAEHRATVFEIETSSNNRCADLSWASQWSSSDDRVLLPLSLFEIKGMRREDNVNFLRLALNSNTKARTMDDLRASRYLRFMEIAEELEHEGRHLLGGSPPLNEYISAALSKIKAEILAGVASVAFQAGPTLYFNMPAQFNVAVDRLLCRWTELLLDTASWHLDHAEALMLDLCSLKGHDVKKSDESDQAQNAGDGEERVAQDAQAKADLLDEVRPRPTAVPTVLPASSSTNAKPEGSRSQSLDGMQTTINRALTQAYRIFGHVGFHASESTAEETTAPATLQLPKKVRQEVLRLFRIRILNSHMCEDPRDVTAALHEDQADMLREGGSSDLTLAVESYSKVLSIFGENHRRAADILFKRTQVGVMLRQAPNTEIKNYDDLLRDYMTCLGLLAQREKTLIQREDSEGTGGIASWQQQNSEQERRHILILKANVHEQVGVLFSSHFPDKLTAAPLSLLEALRTQMHVQGFPNAVTLQNIREAIKRLSEDGVVGAGEKAEQYRLLPCSVFKILINAEDSTSLELSFLINSMKMFVQDQDQGALIFEWGLSCLSCIFQTQGLEFAWQQVVLVLDIIVKAIFYHAECEGVATEACRSVAAVLRRADAWSQFHAHAPKRFSRTHRTMVTCCRKILHLHKHNLSIHSEALAILHKIVTDEVRWTNLQSPGEDGLLEIHDLSSIAILSLDILRDNPTAQAHALEILNMTSTIMTGAASNARGFGIFDRFECVLASTLERCLANVAKAQDGESEKGSNVLELCKICLEKYSAHFQKVKALRDLMQELYIDEAGERETDEDMTEEDCQPLLRTAGKGHLKTAAEALQEGLFDLSRAAIGRAADTLSLAGCYHDTEQEVWQLSHHVAGLEALDTAKSRLAHGDTQRAKAACVVASKELEKSGQLSVDLTDQLAAMELEIASARLKKQEEDARARHALAAEASLEAARAALGSMNVTQLEIAFDQTLAKVEDVSEEVGDPAKVEDVSEEVDDPAAEGRGDGEDSVGATVAHSQTYGVKSSSIEGEKEVLELAEAEEGVEGLIIASRVTENENTHAHQAGADAGMVDDTQASAATETMPMHESDEQAGDTGPADAESGLPRPQASPLLCIAEALSCSVEAENHFEKSVMSAAGGDSRRTWAELEKTKLVVESLLQAACHILVDRVQRLLRSGRVDAAQRTIASAIDDFGKAGLEDRLDHLHLEDLVVYMREVQGLIDIAGKMLAASEASPTYGTVKPAHERLVRAALLIEKHLPCDQDADTNADVDGSIHKVLEGLHVRCGDACLNCPRPLAVETREIYQMARQQFQLANVKIDEEARGTAMSLFHDELAAWEGGGVEVEVAE